MGVIKKELEDNLLKKIKKELEDDLLKKNYIIVDRKMENEYIIKQKKDVEKILNILQKNPCDQLVIGNRNDTIISLSWNECFLYNWRENNMKNLYVEQLDYNEAKELLWEWRKYINMDIREEGGLRID